MDPPPSPEPELPCVVLDMDETLGYFGLFSVVESMAHHLHSRFGFRPPEGAAVRLLLDGFARGEILRPGVVTFLRHLERLRAARVICGVSLFTRNRRAWAGVVRDAIELWLAGPDAPAPAPVSTSASAPVPLFDRLFSREDAHVFSGERKSLVRAFPGQFVVMFDDQPDPSRVEHDPAFHTLVRVSPWIHVPDLARVFELFVTHVLCVPEDMLRAAADRTFCRAGDHPLAPFLDSIESLHAADARSAARCRARFGRYGDFDDASVWIAFMHEVGLSQ